MRLDHLSFAAGPDGLAGTAERLGGLLGQDVHRRRRAPALRHPQHDPAAGRPHLPRGRRGARPPRVRQGAVRPGRARPLRPRRRLARLGRRRRRHHRGRGAARPRGRRRQPAPPRRHRAALEADRRQRPDRRPAAAVLRRSGTSPPSCTPAPAPTARSPWPAWRSPATRSGSASGSARPSRRRSRTSRSSGSPRTAPPASSPRRSRPRTAWSGSERPERHLPGAVPSPNIWHHTATYEIENRAVDPDGRIEAAMARDRALGRARPCSTSAAAPASTCRASPATAASVDRRRAAPRPGRAGRAGVPARCRTSRVLPGTAQALPLPDALGRRRARPLGLLLRPRLRARAGRAGPGRTPRRHRVRDRQRRDPLDVRRVVPARLPARRPAGGVERFWSTHGWTRTPVDMGWRFALARRPGGGGADRVQAGRGRGGPRRATRAPRSTTRSTSGRRRSEPAPSPVAADRTSVGRPSEHAGRATRPSAGGASRPSSALHDLDRDLLERLPHRGEPGRHDLGDLGVVEADDGDVAAGRAGRARRACAARPSPGCRRRRRTPSGCASSSSTRARLAAAGDGVLDPRGQPGGGQAARAAAPGSSRRGGPRRSRSPCASRSRRSARGRGRAGGWWRARCRRRRRRRPTGGAASGVVPGPAERDERRPPLARARRPAGCRGRCR